MLAPGRQPAWRGLRHEGGPLRATVATFRVEADLPSEQSRVAAAFRRLAEARLIVPDHRNVTPPGLLSFDKMASI